MFNGLNFSEWHEQVQFHLGVMDLDLALLNGKPTAITDKSSEDDKCFHKSWECSNRLSLVFMRMTVANNIKSTIPQTESDKEYLKTLGMKVDDTFLVQFILNSLPLEYGPFQINYNTIKDKWDVSELSRADKGLKVKANKFKKKKAPAKVQQDAHKELKADMCGFCKKEGHYQKDCLKRKAWFEKKGIHYDSNYKSK
ncbi:hypothetical protein KY289_014093 [Solanum tuberosum]|nr:hypothetical protein KY289_014093 [Solanum tuberosum]